MENPRLKLIYVVLLPALVIAACVLGYYTFLTARQFERLGEQSIAESSLLLLQDKVERIEQQIITADNQAFGAIDLDDEASVQEWKLHAEDISPSIRALLVLDAERRIVGYAARANADDQRVFRRLFMTRMLQDLELDGLETDRLMHLHRSYGGRSYLISTSRWCTTASATTSSRTTTPGYLVRNVFAERAAQRAGPADAERDRSRQPPRVRAELVRGRGLRRRPALSDHALYLAAAGRARRPRRCSRRSATRAASTRSR